MTATRLRQAASLLREVVNEAQCACGGPACGPEKWFHRGELESRFGGDEKAVSLILTMSPPVALALADWLDAQEDVWSDLDTRWAAKTYIAALAVADALLGPTT